MEDMGNVLSLDVREAMRILVFGNDFRLAEAFSKTNPELLEGPENNKSVAKCAGDLLRSWLLNQIPSLMEYENEALEIGGKISLLQRNMPDIKDAGAIAKWESEGTNQESAYNGLVERVLKEIGSDSIVIAKPRTPRDLVAVASRMVRGQSNKVKRFDAQ